MSSTPSRILPLLVLSQFAATSVWFAGNAIYPDIQGLFEVPFDITPKLTIGVQLGFISGTLSYAIWMIPDRFSPSKVFLVSAFLAALFNILLIVPMSFWMVFVSRFLVGFFLAGVYPVGMKISSDWFSKGLGNALGFLVGALVLGTSFPHLIKVFTFGFSWQSVIFTTSALAILSGLTVKLGIGDGPNRKKAKKFSIKALGQIFQNTQFRRSAFGYFGHMWELYTFWAFTPLLITLFNEACGESLSVSWWSFLIIGVGSLGSILGGLYSGRFGSDRVAFFALSISMLCGLFSWTLFSLPIAVFILVLIVWGFFVIMDSPQFSTIVAQYAPPEFIGSALTIVNCIGFGLTIFSLEVTDRLASWGEYRFVILAIGPILGLIPTGKLVWRKS